jgi:hypothetical protein
MMIYDFYGKDMERQPAALSITVFSNKKDLERL